MSDSLQPHGLQHSRPPCHLPSPRACSNSCPLSWWCHPTVSSSVIPFSSCLQSFPASGSFQWVSSSNQVAKKTYRWLINTWKDAQHHSLLEKCKSKPQWGTISHQSEWPSSKSLQTINARESVVKREHFYTVGGNANWYSPYREQCGDCFKDWE